MEHPSPRTVKYRLGRDASAVRLSDPHKFVGAGSDI